MSGIEELQQRVLQAEEQFGLVNEERAKYSDRLMGLITAVETRIGDQQTEIDRQAAQAAAQAEELEGLRQGVDENKLLRGMLHSLLSAMEAGKGDTLSETMQAMEAKVSALIDGSAVPAAQEAPAPQETEAETPPEPVTEAEAVMEPEVEAAPEPVTEAEEAPEPEVEAAPEPVAEAEEAPEPEIEAAPEPMAEVEAAPEHEIEAAPEPVAEAEEAPEPVAEASPEPMAEVEAAPEPEVESTPEPVAEAAPEPVAEVEAAPEPEASEIIDIPASNLDVAVIDDQMVIGEEAAPVEDLAPDAALESPVDETDAVLDISAAPTAAPEGEDQKPDASSLEDIMRRVSKLVEEEGGQDSPAETDVQSPEAEAPEPAAAQQAASGG